jgi:hypothetical protein
MFRLLLTYLLYAEFSPPSEPMTPLSRGSGEVIEVMSTKLTIVDSPKESDDPVLSSVTATSTGSKAKAVASTSNTSPNSSLPRNQLAIQLLSNFGFVQRIFKVPSSVDLSYKGFKVSFSTDYVPWNGASVLELHVEAEKEAMQRQQSWVRRFGIIGKAAGALSFVDTTFNSSM